MMTLDWDVNAKLGDDQFAFTPPSNIVRIAFEQVKRDGYTMKNQGQSKPLWTAGIALGRVPGAGRRRPGAVRTNGRGRTPVSPGCTRGRRNGSGDRNGGRRGQRRLVDPAAAETP